MRKSMRKPIAFIVLCLLLVQILALPAYAEGGNWNSGLYRFNDFAGILSGSKYDEIEDLAYDNVEIYQFDFPICALNKSDLEGVDPEEYADYYYEHNDFGYGADRDGVLLLLLVDKDEFLIKGYGIGEQIYTGESLKELKEIYYSTYVDEGYYEALKYYLSYAQSMALTAQNYSNEAGGENADGEADGYILNKTPLPYVYDAANLFDAEEEAQMAELIEKIRTERGMDFVVYTDTTSYNKSHGLQAADFYWDNGYGLGSSRDGGVLYICMESGNRGWWTAGTGAAESYYTRDTINELDDRLEPYMLDGEYADGVIHYLQDTDALFATGKVPHTRHYGVAAVIALILGSAAGAANLGVKTAAMKTIRKAHTAANYVIPGSLRLHMQQDHFVTKSISRVKRERSSGSSGGSHSGRSSYSGSYRSSGGGSFSGGGRKF